MEEVTLLEVSENQGKKGRKEGGVFNFELVGFASAVHTCFQIRRSSTGFEPWGSEGNMGEAKEQTSMVRVALLL
jgi:hypothetical protein